MTARYKTLLSLFWLFLNNFILIHEIPATLNSDYQLWRQLATHQRNLRWTSHPIHLKIAIVILSKINLSKPYYQKVPCIEKGHHGENEQTDQGGFLLCIISFAGDLVF